MDPIRQTKAMPPETRERLEIYRLLKKNDTHDYAINILGSNLPLSEASDIKKILKTADVPVRDLTECKTYADFQAMGKSFANLYTTPCSKTAAEDLSKHLGQPYLYLPQVWTYEEIEKNLAKLLSFIGTASRNRHFGRDGRFPLSPTTSNDLSRAQFLASLELRFDVLRHQLVGRSIALDYTFTFLPFSLARLLVSHDLSVTEIYADVIMPDDKDNFEWLQQNAPEIRLFPTKHPAMRTQARHHKDKNGQELIALGQKVTYFTGTHHFVPAIEGGGHYGFEAIHWLQIELSRAALLAKDPEPILKKKAWGAPSCL